MPRLARWAFLVAILVPLPVPAHAASIGASLDSFGALAAATFGGDGIPNDAVAISTIIDGGNTITIGLTAHERFSNPAVLNDGAGTFFAGAGLNDGLDGGSHPLGATWNFGFYVSIAGGGDLADYAFQLLYDFDPGFSTDESALGTININGAITLLGGDPATLTLVEDSQNLFFANFSLPIPGVTVPPAGAFNPFAGGEYTFALRTRNLAGDLLDMTAIQVQVNTVPEPTTLTLLILGGAAGFTRFRRKTT